MIIKLDREYEVKCTLGTIRDIEDSFKKSFVEIVSDIGKLSTREQMKMLFIAFIAQIWNLRNPNLKINAIIIWDWAI